MTATGDNGKKAEELAAYNRVFSRSVPHNAALGLELLDFDRAGMALLRLPYAPNLVGNPETGVLHGGAITSLVDASCGAAVFLGLQPFRPIATLDLRIDYLSPAIPQQSVSCRGHCIRVTRHVAFARAIAYHEDEEAPIATAASTFMIFGGDRSAMLQGTRRPG